MGGADGQVTSGDSGTPAREPVIGGLFFQALDETERVSERIRMAFEEVPELELSLALFSSYIFGCAHKIIGRLSYESNNRPIDIAVVQCCSRLFSDCLGGYALLRQGLLMPAIPVLRAALETTMQAMMFFERPDSAQAWLNGKQFKPSTTRNSSPAAAALYQAMYGRLSDHAHPNVVAGLFHTVPLPTEGGVALMYGGWYAPKSAGLLLIEFCRLELAFLRAFYAAYEAELGRLGLLFLQSTTDYLEQQDLDPQMTWDTFLQVQEGLIVSTERKFMSMEDDHVALAAAISPSSGPGSNWLQR